MENRCDITEQHAPTITAFTRGGEGFRAPYNFQDLHCYLPNTFAYWWWSSVLARLLWPGAAPCPALSAPCSALSEPCPALSAPCPHSCASGCPLSWWQAPCLPLHAAWFPDLPHCLLLLTYWSWIDLTSAQPTSFDCFTTVLNSNFESGYVHAGGGQWKPVSAIWVYPW